MSEARKRDREATERRVVEAAARLMAEEGAASLGINALAKAAGCDKQLIYRYFGGLEGVMRALGEDVAARLKVSLSAAKPARADDWAEFAVALARGLLLAYRADPTLGHIRAAEYASPPGTMRAFSEARGKVLAEWVAEARPRVPPPEGCDVPALMALFTGAIEGCALSAAATGMMAGLPLGEEADWERLEGVLLNVVRATFSSAPRGG